jgi:hypothetical protein
VNEWREDVQAAGELTEELLAARPAIEQVCPTVTREAGLTAWFGNSDIWAWSGADPTT